MEQNRPQRPAGMPPGMRQPATHPAHPQQHAPKPAPQQAPPPASPAAPKPPKKPKGLIIVGVVSVLLIAITVFGFGVMKLIDNISTSTAVKSSQYQAVFLTNNMVYFGKITEINDKYIKMTDIFYLQTQQQTADQKAQQSTPQLSLTKLGGELHGPEDTMYINSKEVMFWENLKADGKVTAAIKDYLGKNGK